jgi:hypothetical protein
MVGAANSDSARISFFGSTKGELAQKLDRGQDAARLGRRLILVPPEPREMVAYYTAHKLCLGDTYYSWGIPIIRRRYVRRGAYSSIIILELTSISNRPLI